MSDPTTNPSEPQRTKTDVISTIRTTTNAHERERPRHIRAMATGWREVASSSQRADDGPAAVGPDMVPRLLNGLSFALPGSSLAGRSTSWGARSQDLVRTSMHHGLVVADGTFCCGSTSKVGSWLPHVPRPKDPLLAGPALGEDDHAQHRVHGGRHTSRRSGARPANSSSATSSIAFGCRPSLRSSGSGRSPPTTRPAVACSTPAGVPLFLRPALAFAAEPRRFQPYRTRRYRAT